MTGKPTRVTSRSVLTSYSGIAALPYFVGGDFWQGWCFSVWRDELSDAWQAKIEAIKLRDSGNFARLGHLGLRVVRVWERRLARGHEGIVA
jgi:G:T-mismatch repair DNA endonuclease (very short patch repair protein)